MSDPKRLLGGYATDTLTEHERRELLAAALEDQELFDTLLEEEGLRELLESPEARQEVLAALERPTRWERVRDWFARPATFADLATVATVLVVALAVPVVWSPDVAGPGRPAASRPAAASVSPATLAHLLALPPHEALPAELEVEGRRAEGPLEVQPGGPLVLRVSLRTPARVLLIAERPDGAAAQVFPVAGTPPATVRLSETGGPAIRRVTLAAPRVPCPYRLRLVVSPVDFDLGAASTNDIDRAAAGFTLVDLTYEVPTP
jgi:hypothetical protein